MTTNQQLNRIEEMEQNLNEITQFLGQVDDLLNQWEQIQNKVKTLENYYHSPDWKQDYHHSNQGKIPKHIPHGVLSEDAIYNTLAQHHSLAVEYLKLITKIISNS